MSDTDISPKPSTALENTALYLDPRVLHHQVSRAQDHFCSPPLLFLRKGVGLSVIA